MTPTPGYADRADEVKRTADALANAKVALYLTPRQIDRLATALENDPDTDFGEDAYFDLAAYIRQTQQRIRAETIATEGTTP